MTTSKSIKPNRRILLTVLVVLTAMASAAIFICSQVTLAEAYSRFLGIKNTSTEKVAKIIRGAEMNANNIFDEVSMHLDDPDEVIAALKSKATLNLDVRGYFAAFAPDYFPQKGTWFEPYVYQPEHGGFDYRQVGSARHNYTKSPWYVQAKESGKSFWSEPYYYYDGTSMSGHYATFVKPIYNDRGELACVCGADPCPVPVVVCPAEEIGKRNLRPRQQVLRRLLQQFLSPEVVMVIDKAVDMVLFRNLRLPVQRFRFQQVIVIPVQRNPRLPVPGEQRLCFPDVRPFRESFSPPFVILRNAVELGKVICEYLHGAILVFSGF